VAGGIVRGGPAVGDYASDSSVPHLLRSTIPIIERLLPLLG